MFKRQEKKKKKGSLAIVKDHSEFVREAEEILGKAEIDWERYASEYPEVDMEEVKERIKDVKGWDSIGFQRVLGGYFYDYGLSLIELFFGLLMFPITMLIMMPYPSASGYYSVASGFFAFLFNVFDFGTAYGLERFIGEYRVKNPQKMLHFIQFYIWYQMLTGLVQVTIVSSMALFFFPNSDLAYASWLFLILSTTQYPGMLGYFKSILRGLQAFHYDNIVDFFRSNVFDVLTRLGSILFFRWVGMTNPAIGDLMGLAIGAAVGAYVDEFLNLALAMFFFNKVMKPYGITAKDCFRHDFTWEEARMVLWWGFQLSLPGIINQSWGFINLLITLTYLPNYAHWGSVVGVIGMITRILTIGSKLSLTSATSESYLNGKIELAQYYVENQWKWYFVLLIGVLGMLVVLLPDLLSVVFTMPGTELYKLAIPFVVPKIIHSIFEPLNGFFNGLILGSDHPTAKTLIDVGAGFSGMVWHIFSYAILQWQNVMAFEGIVMLYTFAGFSNFLAFLFIRWIFCEYYIFHIKVPTWQCFVAPALTTIFGVIPAGLGWLHGVYYPILIPGLTSLLGGYLGPLVAAALTLVMALLVFLFCVYLPLYGFFGGWDSFGLLIFRKAYTLTGPSKPLIKLLYKSTEWGTKRSPWHDKHPIEAKIPFKQSMELLVERTIHDIQTGFGEKVPATVAVQGRSETKPAAKKKESAARDGKGQRFYFTEFLTQFKRFFTKTTDFQKKAIVLSLALYAINISPLALFWLPAGGLAPGTIWTIWISYNAVVSILGIIGIRSARSWAASHDGFEKHGF